MGGSVSPGVDHDEARGGGSTHARERLGAGRGTSHRRSSPAAGDGSMSRTYGGIPEIGSYDVDAIDWASFNKVGWQLAPERAGLLVHDMQRYYAATVPTGMNLLEK